MYYPSSENKGADQLRSNDQLRSYCEADLRLCFRLCRLLVFPCGGSIITEYAQNHVNRLLSFQNMYSRVPACQITTFYYVGFAYMMMRRYQDAIRTFSNILLDIQRTKQMFQAKAQLYDQVGFGTSIVFFAQ